MKVAILISGRINTNRELYDSFCKQFDIQQNDTDVYVSHSPGYSEKTIEEFKSLYNPVDMIQSDEKYPQEVLEFGTIHSRLHNVLCMFLNRKKAFELLVKCGKTYDFIISTRCDLFFSDPIPWETIREHKHNKNILFVPEGSDWGGLNDQFAIGTFEPMKRYCDVFDNILPMVKSGIILHPETLLLNHMKRSAAVGDEGSNGSSSSSEATEVAVRFKMNYCIRRV